MSQSTTVCKDKILLLYTMVVIDRGLFGEESFLYY